MRAIREAGLQGRAVRGLLVGLIAYESSPEAASKKPTTVRGEACNASSFLARLQAMGRTSASEVTEDDLIEVLTGPDGDPAFSPSYVKQVKAVLSAAHGVEGCDRLAAAIPVPKRWRKVGEVLTGDERSDVEDALADEGCALSLRDRAIGRLLLHTGMRASDIASLELRSIDWQLDTISIVQQKTEMRRWEAPPMYATCAFSGQLRICRSCPFHVKCIATHFECACPECGGTGSEHMPGCSLYVCPECGGTGEEHQPGCSQYVCPECGMIGGEHAAGCSLGPAVDTCPTCGGIGGEHAPDCPNNPDTSNEGMA